MTRALSSRWSLLAIAIALGACAPKIGDSCSTSSDCSASGDRLCDPTQTGGYCTIFNCEPGSCPSEAVCIAFQAVPSLASACEDPQGQSRFRRTFCMARCASNGDCRGGYECVDLSHPNDWGATVADDGRGGTACLVPFQGRPVESDAMAAVCTGSDASFSDVTVWSSDAGHDASVDASVGGAGGKATGGAGGAATGGAGGKGGGTSATGGGAATAGKGGGGGTGG